MLQTHAGVVVVGAGPAGLMAAETLAQAGIRVTVYDRMPSPGRKFLIAGRGGLNLTHGEALPAFLARYGTTRERLAPAIEAFPPPPWRIGRRPWASRSSPGPAGGSSPGR